jgi:hypothetical protein
MGASATEPGGVYEGMPARDYFLPSVPCGGHVAWLPQRGIARTVASQAPHPLTEFVT